MCVEVSFPAFFELTERPGCQCEHFPSSASFAHSPFSLACSSELLVAEGLLRSFSCLSKCFLFYNLPFNMEKHLVPN